MQAKPESAALLNSCTFSEISDMCLVYHHKHMTELQKRILDYHMVPHDPYSAKVWIKNNLLDSSAAQPISDVFVCNINTEETEITCEKDI